MSPRSIKSILKHLFIFSKVFQMSARLVCFYLSHYAPGVGPDYGSLHPPPKADPAELWADKEGVSELFDGAGGLAGGWQGRDVRPHRYDPLDECRVAGDPGPHYLYCPATALKDDTPQSVYCCGDTEYR